jgi:hypothetical protein
MSRTKLVFFGGSKGNVSKSATSHLACLGAIFCNQPAAYVLTDPDREIREKGRPYDVLDGRQPKQLANILSASQGTPDGWLIIDGGGNRPAFDLAIYRGDIDTPKTNSSTRTVAIPPKTAMRPQVWMGLVAEHPKAWGSSENSHPAAPFGIKYLRQARRRLY